MKPAILSLLVCSALMTAAGAIAPLNAPAVEAEPTGIVASDLASALGMRWWGYTLTFPAPVKMASVRPCELRRQTDGTWQRTYLAPGNGIGHQDADIAELEVKLFVPDDQEADHYGLKLGDGFGRTTFNTKPDFARTYTTPTNPRFIDGCLALAIEEKDPHIIHGREEDMVRVIALEISTE